MAKAPSNSPELTRAYTLLKAAERGEAAKVLKAYLNKNPRDATGWWLMAHAVTRPDNVRTCLERVLAIDPDHEKARARMDRLFPVIDDEPDDSFFGLNPSTGDAPQAVVPFDIEPAPATSLASAPEEHPFAPTPLHHEAAANDPVAAPPATPAAGEPLPSANPFTASIDEANQPIPPEASEAHNPFAGALDDFDNPFAAPADPAATGSGPDASDVQNPFAAPGSGAEWASPFDPNAANPFAAPARDALSPNVPDWGFDSGADEPANPFAAPDPAPPASAPAEDPGWVFQFDAGDIHDPFASGDPAPGQPDYGDDPFAGVDGPDDPFAGVDGPDDPFADIPVDPHFSFGDDVGPLKGKPDPGEGN